MGFEKKRGGGCITGPGVLAAGQWGGGGDHIRGETQGERRGSEGSPRARVRQRRGGTREGRVYYTQRFNLVFFGAVRRQYPATDVVTETPIDFRRAARASLRICDTTSWSSETAMLDIHQRNDCAWKRRDD